MTERIYASRQTETVPHKKNGHALWRRMRRTSRNGNTHVCLTIFAVCNVVIWILDQDVQQTVAKSVIHGVGKSDLVDVLVKVWLRLSYLSHAHTAHLQGHPTTNFVQCS